jgi:hypothetical protein
MCVAGLLFVVRMQQHEPIPTRSATLEIAPVERLVPDGNSPLLALLLQRIELKDGPSEVATLTE